MVKMHPDPDKKCQRSFRSKPRKSLEISGTPMSTFVFKTFTQTGTPRENK